jgi:hypothetical protein
VKKAFCVLALALAAAALFALDPELTVVNAASYDIYYLLVSPVEEDEWGDNDVLDGEEILASGASRRVSLPEGVYDIMAVDEDDNTYTFFAVEIKRGITLTITDDDIDS